MVKCNKSPTHSQQSVKFRAKPLDGQHFEIADFADDLYVQNASNGKLARENLSSQSPQIISTSELISAAGKIWDCATRSLSHFQPKASFDLSGTVSLKDDDSHYLIGNDSFGINNFIDRGCLHVELNSSSYFSSIVLQSLKFIRTVQSVHYSTCNDHFIENFFLQSGDHGSNKKDIWLKEKNHENLQTFHSLMSRYKWMSQISVWPKHHISASSETKDIVNAFTSKAAVCFNPVSGSKLIPSVVPSENFSTCVDTPNLKDLYFVGINKFIFLSKVSSFLLMDNLLHGIQHNHYAASLAAALSLGPHLDGHVIASAPDKTCEPEKLNVEPGDLLENESIQCEKINSEDDLQNEICSSKINKPHPLLARKEHAVSGALAGVFVSLCLHPIDTIKTIVQSCHPGRKSICYIGQSVLSERGLPGLYRGITSNITTSAPISAIYTFTYESVKEFLLPSLAKEYHSVAHCSAGACASIATSFVFTPSERIKQQMQVNSKYQTCWNAVQRIIELGGSRSLYAGWGAVLCRNIPHSIIKFYTYESLKQMLMFSQPPNKQPTPMQTLLCGGLAGSTAALFSTPFDVVKTRLQTQMPGSIQKYHSIFSALQDIRELEGFRGLYRGLIPRLAMYMSQGALFFASYELFKSFMSLELRQHNSETLQHKPDNNDDPLLSL